MEKEPLPGIQVEFDAGNQALMCLLLTPQEGPFLGLCLHLSVCIPPNYPRHPPQVSIQTPIDHPNVFGSAICCDLLEIDPYRHVNSYAGGYTPAYLLKYLFLQLLSFFSAARIEQDYGEIAHVDMHPEGACTSLPHTNFSCKRCGFNSVEFSSVIQARCIKPLGAVLSSRQGETSTTQHSLSKSTSKKSEKNIQTAEKMLSKVNLVEGCKGEDHLDMLHDHVWLQIFDHPSDQDLINLGRASPRRAGVVLRRYNVSLRRELLCFFTRKTFKEALLGVGVRLLSTNRKPVLLVEAFDLLSLEAFAEQCVRDGICGHKFTHFLPLALDDDHFERAIPSLRKFLTDVNASDVSPVGFLYVIPKLMNSMIVNMMRVFDEHAGNLCEAKRAILQASEKAFKGYCLLFHLLIKLSTRFPFVKSKAEEKLALFLSSKPARNKTNIPDLGEFVAMLPLALKEGYDWGSLSSALVEELLTRNVLWVLRSKPELDDLQSIPRQRRFEETFSASRTGLRLMMLQANFMRALAPTRYKLSETYGFPSDAMATKLVDLVKTIYTVGEGREPYQKGYGAWKDFFTLLHYNLQPNEFEVENMLRMAIRDSKSKGYHDDHARDVPSMPSENKYHARQTYNHHMAARRR